MNKDSIMKSSDMKSKKSTMVAATVKPNMVFDLELNNDIRS